MCNSAPDSFNCPQKSISKSNSVDCKNIQDSTPAISLCKSSPALTVHKILTRHRIPTNYTAFANNLKSMIACNNCDSWYHYSCINLEPESRRQSYLGNCVFYCGLNGCNKGKSYLHTKLQSDC